MSRLEETRNILPGRPSELDVATTFANWSVLAQQFFCAAIVMTRVYESESKRKNYDPMQEDFVMVMPTQIPAQFCLAFSLELAAKAAYISQERQRGAKAKEVTIPSGHKLKALVRKLEGFEVSSADEKAIQWAEWFIVDGKYPSPRSPSEATDGVRVNRSFHDLKNIAEPLYHKLMGLCTSNQNG